MDVTQAVGGVVLTATFDAKTLAVQSFTLSDACYLRWPLLGLDGTYKAGTYRVPLADQKPYSQTAMDGKTPRPVDGILQLDGKDEEGVAVTGYILRGVSMSGKADPAKATALSDAAAARSAKL